MLTTLKPGEHNYTTTNDQREPSRCIHHIAEAIENHQQAMIRSNHHQLQLQMKLLFAAKAKLEAYNAPNSD
jgi:hypothetical protein